MPRTTPGVKRGTNQCFQAARFPIFEHHYWIRRINMPFNRRNFLGASLGLGLGIPTAMSATRDSGPMPSEYEEILARTQQLTYLGHPRSWWTVRQGFLPIAPERVLILEPTDNPYYEDRGDRWTRRHRTARERLHNRLTERDALIPDEKQALIVRLTYELARYYNVLEFWEEWAFKMACREGLGSTGIGRHVAFPHQFQIFGAARTNNAYIDWWMVLLPGGTECWEALDDEPVHVMFTHVFSRPASEDPANYLKPMGLLSLALGEFSRREPNCGIRLSQMDRTTAVRWVNPYIVSATKEDIFAWGN
jgi:mannitol/fructose-specific phosphotransferase system IIA component (Ntr-type)